jgi:mono/diheme cytochrome c family protein
VRLATGLHSGALGVTISSLALTIAVVATLQAQGTVNAARDDAAAMPVAAERGRTLFEAGCAGCHGPGGEGMPDTTVGFAKPDTFPDFTDCESTTPETDIFWKGTIRDGGGAHGFSRIMPAFRDELTDAQIDALIAHLRTLCRDRSWPRGELNLPRPLNTEKAFPENEAVITTAIGVARAHDVGNVFAWEQRFGSRNQIEVSIPLDVVHEGGNANGGIGDIGFGLKRALVASHQRMLSVQGEVILPTGKEDRGLGSGVTVFEAFGAFAQMLPSNQSHRT